ncbi:unnamed protein product [Moneuplotes crassus]|uniref:Uncharacterized protein n=1 Tax=Euplotes crassus TaxID=5936 RepID=A0AAD1XZY4_EUPCR|nr:unnamed protein product [Moneuplotes crassus]
MEYSGKYTGDVAPSAEEKAVFFATTNSGYGGTKDNPMFAQDVPVLPELGERDLALKHTTKTLKHKILTEMREQGALDTEIYSRIKKDKAAIKKQDIIPKSFPSKAEGLKYPEHAMKKTNPLYQTSNNSYGTKKPSELDLPKKYFPKDNKFTGMFLGGNFSDTGLNTFKTPSRVHKNYDA